MRPCEHCQQPIEQRRDEPNYRFATRRTCSRSCASSLRLDGPYWVEEDRGFETPCWIWQKRVHVHGYGHVKKGGKTRTAHRWMYEQIVGAIPDGRELDHLCRVRACVNPSHLEPVTRATNVRRGIVPKLTVAQVASIKAREAERAVDIAREHGVSASTIYAIRHGDIWKDVRAA